MAQSHPTERPDETANVREQKFNGSATFRVSGVDTIERAKAAAKKVWRDEHGSDPSRVVAEKEERFNGVEWIIMVSDHSSGSLMGSKKVEF